MFTTTIQDYYRREDVNLYASIYEELVDICDDIYNGKDNKTDIDDLDVHAFRVYKKGLITEEQYRKLEETFDLLKKGVRNKKAKV